MVVLCALAATIVALACNIYLTAENYLGNAPLRAGPVPQHAYQILTRCAALKTFPGPPADFIAREVSDRFEPGTNSTLIRNATIWTGARNGTEIIFGDLLLDGGIVKGIGDIPDSRIASATGELIVVDANGSWITPGLGQVNFYILPICRS